MAEASSTVTQTQDRNDDAVKNSAGALKALGATIILAFLALIAALLIGVCSDCATDPCKRMVFIIPTASGLLGLLLGFLYSAIGRESQRFGSALTAVNSAFAGAGLADLVRTDSVIRQFFAALATEAGLPSRPLLVGLVAVAAGVGGFLWMYLFKTVAFNAFIMELNRKEDQYEKDRKAVNAGIAAATVDVDRPAVIPQEIKQAAKRLTDESDDTKSLPKERGKAFYLQGRFTEAAQELEQALKDAPGDRGTLLFLANSYISAERPLDAIPALEQLVGDPAAPAVARKMLAYAYLFLNPQTPGRREKLERSVALSRDFLALFPGDAGAALNLACALSQLAVLDKPAHWQSMLEAVRLARQLGGDAARQRIIALTEPHEDFAAWVNDPEFRSAAGM